jgi:alginate O-acetyltransferase complex protein AlgJ
MTQERRFAWSDLPQAIAAVLFFIAGGLLIAQVILGAVAHGKQMKLCAAVYGVTRPATADFTLDNVLTGRYQKALALRIGFSQPYYPVAVRLRNQIEYSLFGVPASSNIVIGRGLQLIEIVYIDEYCSRNVAKFMVGAPAWAKMIRQMQGDVEARGQIFLYVITPSKVGRYPQILPPGMPCKSSPSDRAGLVPAWMAQVQTAGIHVVNTIATLDGARGQYPFPFFPQGGIHWNAVGSALGAQAVEAELRVQTQDARFTPFRFTWRMSSHPAYPDIDLSMIMNMMWNLDDFRVPRITMQQAPKAADCRPVRIVIVAGSFMQRIGPTLSLLPCGARVVQYFYWSIHRDVWTDGVDHVEPVNAMVRDADLLNADVVIYEENEAVIAHAQHGVLLYQWLSQHVARN